MKRKRTLPQLKKKCWDLLSEWVRRSNADDGGYVRCYCCGAAIHWKEAQAAHFVPGRTGAVLLREDLLRPNCVRCNVFLNGNYHAFTLRMIDEVGRAKVEEFLALRYQTRKWTRSELEAFVDEYKRKLDGLSEPVEPLPITYRVEQL